MDSNKQILTQVCMQSLVILKVAQLLLFALALLSKNGLIIEPQFYPTNLPVG